MDILRGDIFYIRKGGTTEGNEQDAGRPAIIVSNDIGNQHANIVEVVYLTTQEKKPLPTHVDIICKVPSVALCEQVCTVSKDRLGDLIRTCTVGEMKEIDKALMCSLGIDVAEQIPGAAMSALEEKSELQERLDDALHTIEKRDAEIEGLKDQLRMWEAEQKAKALNTITTAELNFASLQAECNTYKTMYEKLLEKVMSQKGC